MVDIRLSGNRSFSDMELIVVKTDRPFKALLGRNWLSVISPNWPDMLLVASFITVSHESIATSVCTLSQKSECQTAKSQIQHKSSEKETSRSFPQPKEVEKSGMISFIKLKFPNVLSTDPNVTITGFVAEIHMTEDCRPIFHKAYSVPLRLRDKVKSELNRLVESNVLSPVRHSQWASSIVVVPKPNGDIRICIDCGVTVNKFISTEHYPLPNIEDIFASLANCVYFCVIDLSGAYQQSKGKRVVNY